MAGIAVRLGQWLQLAVTQISEKLYAVNTILTNSEGNAIGVENPLPTDGDSVYVKDINQDESSSGTFTGDVIDLFSVTANYIIDASATNPKYFSFKLKRPVNNNSIKFCSPEGYTFSNTKIILKDASGVTVATVDESGDATAYTSKTFNYSLTTWCQATIEFHTANAIALNWCIIEKSTAGHVFLRAAKPDGTAVDMQATVGGNFKCSLEEFESGISTNSNTQLRTTLYSETGVPVEVDNSGALPTIALEHWWIHRGNHYYIIDWVDLDAAGTIEFTFLTLGAKKIHFVHEFEVTGQIELEVYNTTVAASDGTLITPRNSDENSSNTSSLTVYQDPTITSDGNNRYNVSLGAAGVPFESGGGVSKRSHEIILKLSTKYLFRITSNTNSNRINYAFHWYEVPV